MYMFTVIILFTNDQPAHMDVFFYTRSVLARSVAGYVH